MVSDTEDDEEFLSNDLSSFDEGVAPPEKDNPDMIILFKKLEELEEAKKWKGANPTDTTVVKRPEVHSLHPNVYFDKYMGMKKLKAVEQKLRFARGVLRRFSGKDPATLKTGNRIKLQRAEKILAKVVADHKGIPYVAPTHDVIPPSITVDELTTLNFRARNRIIIAAKKFVPKIEAKKESERTAWEQVQYPFYKEVNETYPEPVRATTEEVQLYNKTKNAIKTERKLRHKEDQLDKALNFIDYLLKYKDQNFTPMTRAKLERSFEIIQKQFKFQGPHKLEASKTQPIIVPKGDSSKKTDAQKQGKWTGPTPPAQQRAAGSNSNNQNDRKRNLSVGQGPVGNRAKVPRNDVPALVNRGGANNNNRRNVSGNQGFGGNQMNRVADIWSTVGAALNQISSQSNRVGGGGGSGMGSNQPDNFRRGGMDRDLPRDNFNSNISDMLFNRGIGANIGGGGGGGFNNSGRQFNDDNNRNFNDGGRFNNSYNDDFNRSGGSFNQSGGMNDFNRSGNDFGGNSSFNNQMGGGNSGNYGNNGGNFNNSGYASSLDLNRGSRGLPIDDLFTRNRSRL